MIKEKMTHHNAIATDCLAKHPRGLSIISYDNNVLSPNIQSCGKVEVLGRVYILASAFSTARGD